MTVHAVQIKSSTEKDSNVTNNFSINHGRPERLPARMDLDVLKNFHERLPSQKSDLSTVPKDGVTNWPEHVRGRYRFREEDDKETLLDNIESKVVKDAKWYKIESHVCTHDGTTRTVEKTRTLPDGTTETYTEEVKGCGPEREESGGWKTERSKGNVPEGI